MQIAFSKYNATISDNRGGWYKNLSSAKVVSVPVSVNSASCKSKFTTRYETRSGFLIPEKKALLL